MGLFQVGVVEAALSCFSRPTPNICSFVFFELGDGLIELLGSGGSQLGIHQKLGLSLLGTVSETVLGHRPKRLQFNL